jgi:hypothetical protein
MAHLIIYSNEAYEHMVHALVASRSYAGAEEHTIVFYMVGYESDINYPNMIKRRWDPQIERENFQFYKPHVMLQSLEFEGELIYIDTDILLGKRFNPSSLVYDLSHPVACIGPLEYVFLWNVTPEGETIKYDESLLMDYLSVGEKTTQYLWTSMLSYSRESRDFLQEWCSVVDNSYFRRDDKVSHYMPFGDETAFNVIMWRRKHTYCLPRLFMNTTVFDTLQKVEQSEDYSYFQRSDGDLQPPKEVYERCDDSGMVQFYHGVKEHSEIIKVVSWMLAGKKSVYLD